jgi:hypothetical protein
MKIKSGSSCTLKFLIQDQDGNVIQNLSTATAVKFMVKLNKTDADTSALISKGLLNGIVVNSPSTGYVSVTLVAADTASLTAGNYFFGLKIEYPGTPLVKYEADIYYYFPSVDGPIETIAIDQGVVHDV